LGRRQPAIEPEAAVIAAGIAGVIVYGSLFPFHFWNNPDPAGPLRALLATWRARPGRGDFIANILLYMPFAFFAVRSLVRLPPWARLSLVLAAGCVMSAAMELTQFYDSGRDSAMSDVYANSAGTLLGAAAGTIFRRELRLPVIGAVTRRPFVALLVTCWLGYRLYPYAPVIDLHQYWSALKPLVFSPKLPPLDLYRHTVVWLALALLLESLFGIARSRVTFLLFVPGLLLARVPITGTVLSPAEVVGGGMALVSWIALLSRVRGRAVLIAILFAGVVVIQGLAPFEFTGPARAFGWIPFLSFMEASMDSGIGSFFEKAFTYGSLIWLAARAGCPLGIATATGGALVFCLRLAQVYLPGRSAEITDLIILLAVAAAMKLMAENPSAGVSEIQPLQATGQRAKAVV
jgi:VanZ family protein